MGFMASHEVSELSVPSDVAVVSPKNTKVDMKTKTSSGVSRAILWGKDRY
jgi:hypothetical protein